MRDKFVFSDNQLDPKIIMMENIYVEKNSYVVGFRSPTNFKKVV